MNAYNSRLVRTIAVALIASTAIVACAINARAETVATESVSQRPYIEVLRECGAKWKGRDDKVAEKGTAAWQAFRAMCVTEAGYKRKK